MGYKVFIDGGSGTTGLKLEQVLGRRADVELLGIAPGKRKDVEARLGKMSEADISFLCLPDAESAAIAERVPADARLIDASTHHRIHAGWVYGLPELNGGQRARLQTANRVALPGCHATGFILLVRPLIDAGLVGADYPFAVHSVTGYSGGGKGMIAQYAADRRKDRERDPLRAPRQYAMTQQHKHLPEMTKMAGLSEEPIFVPHVADYYSGLSMVVPLRRRLLAEGATAGDVRRAIEDRYREEPFIGVAPADADPEAGYLSAGAMSGRNDAEIFVAGNAERIILVARYDNLGKGASGAGVQCMNIMLGIPEERGLLE
ncbi:MAG: N-acetyl-gamma-glutamyl-phosphate reductase [Clostridiales Family XIII bacterium]|jgi:N-acetyl-gamma-glutamyl-phosphate reductase|nr:N-acetyl-gamma-glutamyl-phosphate reductase [Clostridiales Family XIII bacterium]